MHYQRHHLFKWLEELSEQRKCPLRVKNNNTATLCTEEGLIFEFEYRALVDLLAVRVRLAPYPWVHPERLCRAALSFDRKALQRIDATLAVTQPTHSLVLCYNPRLSHMDQNNFERMIAYLEQISADLNQHLRNELAEPTNSFAA